MMENNVAKIDTNEVSLTLEQIEVRMDMLIQQTKLHFLEMGKLLYEAKHIEVNKKGKTSKQFLEYANARFGLKKSAIGYMLQVWERFNKVDQNQLPFNNYTSLALISSMSDDDISDFVNDTFEINGESKKGAELSHNEISKVLREKRELEKALEEANRVKEEEKRLAEELAQKEKELEEVKYQLEYAKKIEDTELELKAEEKAEEIVEAKKALMEQQIKEKIEEEIELDAEKLAEQKIKEYKLSIYRTEQFHKEEKRKIAKEKELLISKQGEIQKNKAIIGEGLRELEKVKKQVAEKEAYLEKLKIEEDRIREDKNKIEQLNILFEKINDINTIVNRVTQKDYEIYLEDERVKKYIEISANMLNEASERFSGMANVNQFVNVEYREV